MPLDFKTYFATAVANNLNYLRQQLLASSDNADRWVTRNATIIGGITEGFEYPDIQTNAVQLLIDLLPLIERWGVWADYLQVAESALMLELPEQQRGYLHAALGHVYYLNRNFADAQAQLNSALAIASRQHLTALKGLVELRLTNVFLGRKDYEKARAHGQKALVYLAGTNSKALAALHNTSGLIELELGNTAAAEASFGKALALWDDLKNYTQIARSYLNLGALFFRQGKIPDAKRCYKRCLEALDNSTSTVDRLKASNGLGTILYMTGDLTAAESIFRRGVVEAKDRPGLYHLRGSLTHNLGNTLLAQKRLEEARIQLGSAITIWRQANDDLELANSIGTLAEVYEVDTRWALAVSAYDEALALVAQFPDHRWASRLAKNFAEARQRCVEQLALAAA